MPNTRRPVLNVINSRLDRPVANASARPESTFPSRLWVVVVEALRDFPEARAAIGAALKKYDESSGITR